VRAFRLKSFRQQAAADARSTDGLSDEQHKAMEDEFDRRIANFKSNWLVCCNRRCRRQRGCLGPPFACHGSSPPRWTTRLYRRLKRDVVRNPPRV
jgi:hypothetical protein